MSWHKCKIMRVCALAIVLHREDNLWCESFITLAHKIYGWMYIPRFNKMAKGKCNTPSITRRKFLSHSSQKMTYAKRGFLKQKEFRKNEECFKVICHLHLSYIWCLIDENICNIPSCFGFNHIIYKHYL